MSWLLIGQVATLAEVRASTIRYYEDLGLLAKARRSAGGYRQYRETTIGQLRFVRLALAAGLSLKEIRPLVRLIGSRRRPTVSALRSARQHLKAAKTRYRKLEVFRSHLRARLSLTDRRR